MHFLPHPNSDLPPAGAAFTVVHNIIITIINANNNTAANTPTVNSAAAVTTGCTSKTITNTGDSGNC